MGTTLRFKSYLLGILMLYAVTGVSQPFYLSGTISSDDEYVVYANVTLLHGSDSSWLQTVNSDTTGSYIISIDKKGTYLIKVQAFGYETLVKKLDIETDNLEFNIKIQRKNSMLDGVVIEANKNRLEVTPDKTVVNLSDNIKKGKSVLDILHSMPGVSVRPDGTIALEGKHGVIVMIDDKVIRLSGKALGDMLRGMNADNLKTVEIITQPSAKYDANGDAGIINLTTTTTQKQGLTGSATAKYVQGRYPAYAGNLDLNYQRNKTNIYIRPGLYKGTTFLIPYEERMITGKISGDVQIQEEGFVKETFAEYGLSGGVQHQISDKLKVDAFAKWAYHPDEEWVELYSLIDEYSRNETVTNHSNIYRGFSRNTLQTNLQLDLKTDTNSSAILSADYFLSTRDDYQNLKSVSTPSTRVGSNSFFLRNNMYNRSEIFSVKLDYSTHIGKKVSVDAGLKSNHTTVTSPNKFALLKNNEWVADPIRSYSFLYKEQVNAGYVSISRNMSAWQLQLGARIEHIQMIGDELTTNKSFDKDFLSCFPTAYISYKLDDNNSLSANYGRRINRPYYTDLTPYVSYNSQFSYSTGNPELVPAFTNRVELKYAYKNSLFLSLTYQHSKDILTSSLSFDENTNTSIYSIANNASGDELSISTYLYQEIAKWFTTTFNAKLFYLRYSGNIIHKLIQINSPGLTAQIYNQFRINNNWNAYLGVNYSSRYNMTILNNFGPFVFLHAGISKKVFGQKGVVSINTQDPFRLYRHKERYSLPGIYTISDPGVNTQNIYLTFAYSFGRSNRNNPLDDKQLEEADRFYE